MDRRWVSRERASSIFTDADNDWGDGNEEGVELAPSSLMDDKSGSGGGGENGVTWGEEADEQSCIDSSA